MNLLIEHLNPTQAALCEQQSGGNLFLNGIIAQASIRNGNGRIYALSELSKAMESVAQQISDGHLSVGELGHPDVLTINLSNVSHAITEVRMDGNNAIGKMKILNTPAGNIAKGLIEGGVRLGVSTRGTGNVNEAGEVSDYSFCCLDIVHQPSAPGAYPDVVQEALNSTKIVSLAEAVVHDKKAQEYFTKELRTFILNISKGMK